MGGGYGMPGGGIAGLTGGMSPGMGGGMFGQQGGPMGGFMGGQGGRGHFGPPGGGFMGGQFGYPSMGGQYGYPGMGKPTPPQFGPPPNALVSKPAPSYGPPPNALVSQPFTRNENYVPGAPAIMGGNLNQMFANMAGQQGGIAQLYGNMQQAQPATQSQTTAQPMSQMMGQFGAL
jgi:hypothetical protein